MVSLILLFSTAKNVSQVKTPEIPTLNMERETVVVRVEAVFGELVYMKSLTIRQ